MTACVIVLKLVVLMASAVVLVRSEPALNRMSRETTFLVRVAFHLLAVGSAAQIVFVVVGDTPSWPTAILLVGVAGLLACEKRLRILTPRGKS